MQVALMTWVQKSLKNNVIDENNKDFDLSHSMPVAWKL